MKPCRSCLAKSTAHSESPFHDYKTEAIVHLQSTTQGGGASSGDASAPAPTQKYRVVQTPNPRRFEYTGDIASGSPQAAAAYAKQVSAI